MNSRFKLCASVLLLSVVGWGTVQTAAQEPTRSDEQIQLSHLDNNSVKKKDSLSTGKEIRGLINNADSLLRTRPDSALSLLKIAEEKSLHIGNFDKATLARIKMGLAAISIGDFHQSFSHYGTAYRYVQQAKNYDQLLPWILIDIGTIYTHQHQYERATQHYLVVLEFLEKYNPKHPNRIIAYSNLGAVLINTGQYERADEYLRLAGELASEIGDDYYLAYTLGNRGGVALGRKRYSTALDFYKQANHIAQHIGNIDLQQGILTAIGQTMLALDLPDSAIFYTQKALELDPPTNSFNSTSVPYYTMGIAWYKKKGYREAEAALLKGLLQIRKTDLAEERAEAINTLSHIYAATNKPEKAFQYAQQYISLKDSLLNKEKLRIINQLEAAYRTVQKDKELAQQHLKIVAQKQTIERKNILITGSITGIGLLSILLLVFHRNS